MHMLLVQWNILNANWIGPENAMHHIMLQKEFYECSKLPLLNITFGWLIGSHVNTQFASWGLWLGAYGLM